MDTSAPIINEPISTIIDSSIAPLITISREKGSGGRPVAYRVAAHLKDPWKIYDQETLEQIARENEMKSWFEEQTDEETRKIIQEKINTLFGPQFHVLEQKFKDLIMLLATVGHQGHAIIVGRGAHILFPNALKVRLICALEQRIEWIKKYEHLTTKEAIAVVKESDLRKDEFIRTLYRNDLKIHYHYDMILRTSENIQLEDAAAAIVHLAKRKFRM